MTVDNRTIGVALVIIVLLAMTAGASALITRNNMEDKTVTVTQETVTKPKTVHHTASNNIHWNDNKQVQQQPARPVKTCSDGNVVGAVLGAVGGGLVGSQIGGGKGKDVATIGGAAVGGLAGQQYIPTKDVLCSN
jgi:uncharacterized protein YcfJ